MASFSTTTAAVFLPTIWAKMALLARERVLVMGKRVLRYDAELREGGNLVNIPQVQNLTTNAVAADGSYTPQAPTENKYQINVNRWREASISVPDLVAVQASYPLLELYTRKIGYALGLDVETQLLGLYSSVANSAGTAGVALTDDVLLNAIQLLDQNDNPLEDRTMIFLPKSKRSLMKIDKFALAYLTGLGKGAQITGLFGEIYGIPIFFSNNVTSSGGDQNLIFHKEAFALAIQIDVKIEKFRLKLADDVAGHILYGTLNVRNDAIMGVAACTVLT